MAVDERLRDITSSEWQDLVASERQLRSLVSNVAGMVYRVNAAPPWKFLFVSDGVDALTGYPAAHFIRDQNSWADLMLPEEVATVSADLAVRAGREPDICVEHRIRHRDGSIRWVEARVRVLPGDPPLYEGTVFDIDARKRAQQALVESQEHLRYIVESVPSTLWTAGPDGEIEFISEAGQTYIGAPPDERRGHGWLRFVHPEDRERVQARWQRSLASGDLYETSFRQGSAAGAAGGYRWLQARAICRRDADGRPVRWYGITTDVTALFRAQEQLRESEELARATVQSVPGIVWRADAEGNLDFISDACQTRLGWAPTEVTGDRWLALVHRDDLPAFTMHWRRALRTGAPIHARYRVRDRQGTYRWQQVSAIASRDAQGHVARWYGLVTDIEDLLQARLAAESAVRAKSAFLSTMSHEIRTPLNAVLGFAGLLGDTQLGAQQRDFVNSIRASGDHLLAVIDDILDFSKLESGRFGLDYAPCNLRELVESALDLVASQAAPKNIELLYRIDDDVPLHCLVDQPRLKQVLANLLSNAVKFTAAGEVEVRVRARELLVDDYEFNFSVRDTGIGIPVDQHHRLFRDFSQVDDSVSRRFGGTGLGLAISKRLVEAHGGTMRVDSTPGVGSTFSFCVPAQICEPSAPPLSIAPDTLKGRRVLLVDDNRNNLEILSGLLQAWGMDLVAVDDPLQALTLVENSLASPAGPRFELAVLDHQMPGLDGLELTRRLHALGPMPVVLLTSLGTTMADTSAAGVDIRAVLTKPVHRSSLAEALGAVPTHQTASRPLASITEVAGPMPPLRLLLAEDNLTNRKVAQLLLRKLGYEQIDIAIDGREAVDAVLRTRYDVVLMDVQMPALDGLDATRRIRREVDPLIQPQVVAMTANALADDREACLAAGMDDYIPKPIDPARLAQALLAAAERRGWRAPSAAAPRPTERENAETRARRLADQILAGGGDCGALMRRMDWSRSPLGPVCTWPQSLRTALSIVLTQRAPLLLWWGPEMIQFYNDGYRPILGRDKHPAAMGQRGPECWPEVWSVVGPLAEAAMLRGESSWIERGLLYLERNGFLEEAYFSYSYSPIRDESGGIGGVFVAVTENTADVVAARRSALLLDLDEYVASGARWTAVQPALESAFLDLPFSMLYEVGGEGETARLIGTSGIPAGSALAPAVLARSECRWPIFDPGNGPRRVRLEATGATSSPWPESAREVLAIPLPGDRHLIAGFSPRLPIDEAYTLFLVRLAARVGPLG